MLAPGFYNMDCMEGMKQFPDKYFDLAIVDPPYGGGGSNKDADAGGIVGGVQTSRTESAADLAPGSISTTLQAQPIKVTRTGGKWFAKRYKAGAIFSNASIQHWDIAPDESYFRELARVSKNQIIWGGNYFNLPPTRCFVVWEKTIPENFSMAMCEYAWTSFNDNAKSFICPPQGTSREKRFHPTQKPVRLYSWLLGRYAKAGDRILDTHVGSASSLIACHRAGLEFVGFEIDTEYYQAARERLEREIAQVNIYDLCNEQEAP